MNIEVKDKLTGGLDLDTSYYKLRPDCYVDALNITRDAIAGNNDEVPTNIVGNRLVDFTLPAGTNKTIGAFPFPLRNTVIEFLYNSNGRNSIIEYDNTTRTRSLIFQCFVDSADDILGFTADGKICNVNVYPNDEDGDLLFFLDSLGRPTIINIKRFKADEYNPVTRDIINVAKRPPLSPPDCVYDNDATRNANNLRNKLFKFQQVWVYDDNEESTFSPQSSVALPINILDPVFTNVVTNNNVIRLSLSSGPKNVKAVRLLMSYVEKSNNWSDFATVEVINKADNSIVDDSSFAYAFYNNSTYPTYDILRAIQLFDSVPITAESQEMANGNTIEYAAIEEGLSRDITPNVVNTVLTVAAGNGGVIGSLNGVVTNTSPLLEFRITFSGIPATGTVVTVKATNGTISTVATYTTVAGDSAFDVITGLRASAISLGIITVISFVSPPETIEFRTFATFYVFSSLTIVPPTSAVDDNSIATWKWSTERNIGIAYFDQQGRTNGILYNAHIIFPNYQENGSQVPLLPYINTKIYHVPPDWAYSYQFYFTKEPTQYIFWETIDVNNTESDYIYFDISNMALNALKNPTVANVLNYSFADGDRMRLIRQMSDGFVFGPTFDTNIEGLVINPKINNVQVTGNFIKIKKQGLFAALDYSTKFFVIELYRPGQQLASDKNATYYEFGEEYSILNPTTATRTHAGQVTNQSTDYVTPAEFNFYEGDSYFRSRTVYLSETGFGTFNVQDRNFVDFYISAVSSISGRPNLIDDNAKPTFFPAVIRFSEAVQPNTNINGLNRFFPENFIEADNAFGAIKRMKVRDRQLEIFQSLKVGFSPIFSQLGKAADGSNVLLTTDKLLNPVQYYQGDWGIGEAATSLAYFNYAIYFCDTTKGVVLRLSRDGLTPLSILYNINSWATDQIPQRIGNYKIYGAFDQKANNYIFALEATADDDAITRAFSERSNSFESRLSYNPEMMCALGTLLISWKNGQLYTHDSSTYNNFFGVQYESSITLIWNKDIAVKKTYNAIGYQSNRKWVSPANGDVITSNINPQTGFPQISNIKSVDYELQENVTVAAFNRDANSGNDAVQAVLEGDYLKGTYVKTKLTVAAADATELVYLISPYINYSISQRNF